MNIVLRDRSWSRKESYHFGGAGAVTRRRNEQHHFGGAGTHVATLNVHHYNDF
jgi:hypothetical protein